MRIRVWYVPYAYGINTRMVQNIYINPDRTKKERAAAKELRDELKRRKSSGEINLVIRRNIDNQL